VKEVDGIKLLIERFDGVNANLLKRAVDDFKNQFKDCVICFIGEDNGKAGLVLGAAGKPLDAGFDSKKMINIIAKDVSGGGGGRPDLAQAGGKDVSGIDKALVKAREVIEEAIKG